MGKLIQNKSINIINNIFSKEDLSNIQKRFLNVPLYPNKSPDFDCDKNNLLIGDVNIIDYALYNSEDQNAVAEAKSIIPNDMHIVSVETTHGIIAASTISYTNSPIIFLSGIVNQVGEFNKQVSPKPEAQNFAAAFNAGIVVAWLLPRLDALEKYS